MDIKNETFHPKVAVFIDAANVWAVQKSKGMLFDYKKLADFLKEKFQASTLQVFYYSGVPLQETRNYDVTGYFKFLTYLKNHLKFQLRTKKLKPMQHAIALGDSTELPKEKGNMDVEITIDAIRSAPFYDVAIFLSGDSDFHPLVTCLRNYGKKVYIFSSKNNVSRELRSCADGYFDLLKVKKDIWRTPLIYRSQKNKTALPEEGRP